MTADSDIVTWATAVSTNADNGRKIIFRYVEHLRPTFNKTSQPIRAIIVWKYLSEDGQPIAEDYERMMLLEDALESAFETDRFGTLAIVSTGEDLREWTYYVRSEAEFMARLNYALAEKTAFPIEIHTASDPNWDVYEQFRVGILQKPHQ